MSKKLASYPRDLESSTDLCRESSLGSAEYNIDEFLRRRHRSDLLPRRLHNCGVRASSRIGREDPAFKNESFEDNYVFFCDPTTGVRSAAAALSPYLPTYLPTRISTTTHRTSPNHTILPPQCLPEQTSNTSPLPASPPSSSPTLIPHPNPPTNPPPPPPTPPPQ